MPIFRAKSVKIYTDQKKIYTGIPMAPVTNIRYLNMSEQCGWIEQAYGENVRGWIKMSSSIR